MTPQATYSPPYRNALGHGLRPYLALRITGPNGRSGPIWGLIDSGADVSCLPLGFARLMGYGASDLVVQDAQQVGGAVRAYVAKRPSTAIIVGLTDPAFELWPSFIDGSLTPLWGRADLFKTFIITIDDVAQQFQITTR